MYKTFLGYKTADHDNSPSVFTIYKIFNSKPEAEEWINYSFKNEQYDAAEIEEINGEDDIFESKNIL
jgi:hypothetical protein